MVLHGNIGVGVGVEEPTKIIEIRPSEHSTLTQRLRNVDQTSWTFGRRWIDVVPTSRIHWGYLCH